MTGVLVAVLGRKDMRFTIIVVSMLTLTSFICGTPHIDIVVIIACMGAFDWFQRNELRQTRLLLTRNNENESQKQARNEIARQAKWINQLCEQKHKLASEIVTMEDSHAREIKEIKIRYTNRHIRNCNSGGKLASPVKYHERTRRLSESNFNDINSRNPERGYKTQAKSLHIDRTPSSQSLDLGFDINFARSTLAAGSFASTVTSSEEALQNSKSPEHNRVAILWGRPSAAAEINPGSLRKTKSADAHVFSSMWDY